MVLPAWKKAEIERKVHAGLPLDIKSQDSVAYYNAYKTKVSAQVVSNAKAGLGLSAPSTWKTNLYNSVNAGGSNIGQQGAGVPQYNPMPAPTGTPTTNAPGSNPVLDQTTPVIIGNTNNQPTVPIGSGEGNPTNRLELNSLVAVVVGFFFVRGAFKLLTKIF